MRKVIITWLDSLSDAGWCVPNATHNMKIESVGYLMSETEDRYIITTTMGPDGMHGLSPLQIPKAAVVDVVGLDDEGL